MGSPELDEAQSACSDPEDLLDDRDGVPDLVEVGPERPISRVQRVIDSLTELFSLTPEQRFHLAIEINCFLRWFPRRPSGKEATFLVGAGGLVVGVVAVVGPSVLLHLTHEAAYADGGSCRGVPTGTNIGVRFADGSVGHGSVKEGRYGPMIVYNAALGGILRNVAECSDPDILAIWPEEPPDPLEGVLGPKPKAKDSKPASPSLPTPIPGYKDRQAMVNQSAPQPSYSPESVSQPDYSQLELDARSAVSSSASSEIRPQVKEPFAEVDVNAFKGKVILIEVGGEMKKGWINAVDPTGNWCSVEFFEDSKVLSLDLANPANRERLANAVIIEEKKPPAQIRWEKERKQKPVVINLEPVDDGLYHQGETVFTRENRLELAVQTEGAGIDTAEVKVGEQTICRGQEQCIVPLPEDGTPVNIVASAERCDHHLSYNWWFCVGDQTSRVVIYDDRSPEMKLASPLEINQGQIIFSLEAGDGKGSGLSSVEVSVEVDGEKSAPTQAMPKKGKKQVDLKIPVFNFGPNIVKVKAADNLGNKAEVVLGRVTYEPMKVQILSYREGKKGKFEITAKIHDPTNSVSKTPQFIPRQPLNFAKRVASFITRKSGRCEVVGKDDKNLTLQVKCSVYDRYGKVLVEWTELEDIAGRKVPGSSGRAVIDLAKKPLGIVLLDGAVNLWAMMTALSMLTTAVGATTYRALVLPYLVRREKERADIVACLEEGFKLLNKGNVDEARAKLEEIPENKRSPYIIFLINQTEAIIREKERRSAYRAGLDYMRKGQWLEAIKVFVSIQGYRDVDRLLKKARGEARIARFDALLAEAEEFLGKKVSDYRAARARLERIDPDYSRYDDVKRLLERCNALETDHCIRTAQEALKGGDYQTARTILNFIRTTDPRREEVDSLLNKCRSLEMTELMEKAERAGADERYRKAIQYYQRILKLGGDEEIIKSRIQEAKTSMVRKKTKDKATEYLRRRLIDEAFTLLQEAGFDEIEIGSVFYRAACWLDKRGDFLTALKIANHEGIGPYAAATSELRQKNFAREVLTAMEELKKNEGVVKFCKQNHYQVLGVGIEATAKEIKRARAKRLAQLHPDKTRGDVRQTAINSLMAERVEQAADVLLDKETRQAYDRVMGFSK